MGNEEKRQEIEIDGDLHARTLGSGEALCVFRSIDLEDNPKYPSMKDPRTAADEKLTKEFLRCFMGKVGACCAKG